MKPQKLDLNFSKDELDSIHGPSKRWGHQAVQALGKMFIIGGYDGEYLGDIWCFEPERLEWIQCQTRAAQNSMFYRSSNSQHSVMPVSHCLRGHLL